mgnify:CR=1 FL=1
MQEKRKWKPEKAPHPGAFRRQMPACCAAWAGPRRVWANRLVVALVQDEVLAALRAYAGAEDLLPAALVAAVRDLDAPRDIEIPRHLLTTDAHSLILGADIVVELIGGLEPAREYLTLALTSGADVITANKALLATHGPELFELLL